MPCDVASDLERSAIDLATLARYAKLLDADVVAVQEVDGPAAARHVFPQHDFCFTGARALQNTGFAIRRGIPHRCEADVMGLSQGDAVRRGAVVVLFPGTAREIHLLGVHLKSGCAQRALDGRNDACQRLSRQAGPLEAWIDAQARAGRRFALLGDFNRDLLGERGPARGDNGMLRSLWHEINDGDPRGAELLNTAAGVRFRNCATGQNHTGFIDYILLGGPLRERWLAGSFERVTWQQRDAARLRLSDHCPVAIRLRP
jgi:endonuclease/exonuclease/phosphatase family metal-dependent hydrolase